MMVVWSLISHLYKNSDVADAIPPLELDDTILIDDLDKARPLANTSYKHLIVMTQRLKPPKMLNFFRDNFLLSLFQAGCHKGNQLLEI